MLGARGGAHPLGSLCEPVRADSFFSARILVLLLHGAVWFDLMPWLDSIIVFGSDWREAVVL